MSGYTTKLGRIYDGATEIQLRGISHFGCNGENLVPMGLWNQGWKEQIAHIYRLGFNAVRLPFTPETLYSPQTNGSLGTNTDLVGKTPLQVLDLWMTEADRTGLYILLDFHSPTNKAQFPTWFCNDASLTYNGQPYLTEHWLRDLAFVSKRYAHLPRFIGIDLYNEPHSLVRWDVGDANYDATQPHIYWRPAAEAAAAAVLAANQNLLVFVQGTEANWNQFEKPGLAINYGENLQSQKGLPLRIPANKLVLSPHTYGPYTMKHWPKPSFSAPDFPKNLAADWETLFGQFASTTPVVIGEWGGSYEGADKLWHDALIDYMISKDMTSSFYWSYYGSGDTRNIVNGDLSVNQDIVAMLHRLWAAAPKATPLPDPPPIVPPVVTPPSQWIEKPLCMVVDSMSGIHLQFAGNGFQAVVGTLSEALAYVKKSRVGLEARTVIQKFTGMVYRK